MDNIIIELQEELNYQKNLMIKLEYELLSLPPGSLCTKKVNGNEYVYIQEYKIDEVGKKKRVQRCVPKKDVQLAEKILRRRFAEKSIINLRMNINRLEIFIDKYKPFSATDIYNSLSKGYLKFDINGYLSNKEMEIICWDEDFKHNSDINPGENCNFYPNDLKHITSKGLVVRSKSEAIICELLDHHKVLYKYEKPLFVGDKKYYPDFTIMRKFDRKIMYWEHFGMIGNIEYSRNMARKIKDYESIGITPWENLIITTDSIDGRINIRHIVTIISNTLVVKD